jgi:hypothetical protein
MIIFQSFPFVPACGMYYFRTSKNSEASLSGQGLRAVTFLQMRIPHSPYIPHNEKPNFKEIKDK